MPSRTSRTRVLDKSRPSRDQRRQASHAGSWYSNDPKHLNSQLSLLLKNAPNQRPREPVRAVVVPHAGYTFSAQTASFAYKHIDIDAIDQIVVMGPSHHKWIPGIALTPAHILETPIGNLKVNVDEGRELKNTGLYHMLNVKEEEAEHSLEMHFPWIAKIFERRLDKVTVLPLVVGDLRMDVENESEEDSDSEPRNNCTPGGIHFERHNQMVMAYAETLMPLLLNPKVLFVISTDFCHWGNRFDYIPYNPKCGPIHESIRQLDKQGMDEIESLDPRRFQCYMTKTSNTICGRNPIALFLEMIFQASFFGVSFDLRWLHYTQSNEVEDEDDSSVSYASGIIMQRHCPTL